MKRKNTSALLLTIALGLPLAIGAQGNQNQNQQKKDKTQQEWSRQDRNNQNQNQNTNRRSDQTQDKTRNQQVGEDEYYTTNYQQHDQQTRQQFGENVRETDAPGVDLVDQNDKYIALIDLPGTAKDKVKLSIDGRRLTIWGKMGSSHQFAKAESSMQKSSDSKLKIEADDTGEVKISGTMLPTESDDMEAKVQWNEDRIALSTGETDKQKSQRSASGQKTHRGEDGLTKGQEYIKQRTGSPTIEADDEAEKYAEERREDKRERREEMRDQREELAEMREDRREEMRDRQEEMADAREDRREEMREQQEEMLEEQRDDRLAQRTRDRSIRRDTYEDQFEIGERRQREQTSLQPGQTAVEYESIETERRFSRAMQDQEIDGKYITKERRSGTFHRTIMLPTAVKEDQVQAKLVDGLLTVVLPKDLTQASVQDTSNPREIRIQ